MAVTQSFLVQELAASQNGEEMARSGVHAVFRAKPSATTPLVFNSLERRERAVLLLLNGQRTLQDIAKLIHRSDVDVAHTLVHLLQRGYIEFHTTPRKN
jgi:DNA-binding NarL/FixJ family response regulator